MYSSPLSRLRRAINPLLVVALIGLTPLLSSGSAVPASASSVPSGYWMVASDGGIFAYGGSRFFGSTGNVKLNMPIVGMAATPSGNGYWMVATDGGVFSFGDAGFFGSTGAIRLNRPIVGMAATPSGNGYWMVASDGGIFSFGDARFFGSTGALALSKPISGIAATPSGDGYWLTATDGGVFSFGDASYKGAAPERPSQGARAVVAMVPSPTGAGYWQAAASGELLAFGDAKNLGNPASLTLPIVGMAAVPRNAVGTGTGGFCCDLVLDPGVTTTTTAPVPYTAPQYFANAANLTWGTSISTVEANKAGRVLALAEAGNTIFVGGEFNGASFPDSKKSGDPNCTPTSNIPADRATCVMRPFLFALDVNTGAILDWDAHVNDAVLALEVSPDGKQLYVGGRFTKIGGAPAGRIARLDIATATQDRTFQPPRADSGVQAIALHGDVVYIG
ncbi:MAG TPA: delta-60 repeat domain-containing protein, partial [Acidimicrobiia bacterium]|nr:delta-60 repeat domain-containing protein [Acidimicrobiia bacterium]